MLYSHWALNKNFELVVMVSEVFFYAVYKLGKLPCWSTSGPAYEFYPNQAHANTKNNQGELAPDHPRKVVNLPKFVLAMPLTCVKRTYRRTLHTM